MSRFPFSESFQFREDEATALEALFERIFFGVPYSERAAQALQRIQWTPPRQTQGREERAGEPLADHPRYVALCRGPHGIGKTRIFRHLRERASARQVPVYEIYNYAVEGIPLKPFLHVIRQILHDLEHDIVGGPMLLEKYRFALESLIPEAFDSATHASPSSTIPKGNLDTEKVRVYDGIAQLLLEVSAQKPLVILVHDLHWGDRGTVELLRYIGRNLQLRERCLRRGRAALSGDQPDEGQGARRAEHLFPSPSGPEFEGFDNEEWRVLAPRPMAPHLYSVWAGEEEAIDPGTGAAESRLPDGSAPTNTELLPRLMFLANYRAFPSEEDYIQQAITSLGQESFAYHGELRLLGREEADRFIQKSVEGVRIDDEPLSISDGAVDAIFEFTEGFPSFKQELLRGVYLNGAGATWTEETVRSFVADGGRFAAQIAAGSPSVDAQSAQDAGTEEPAATTDAEAASGHGDRDSTAAEEGEGGGSPEACRRHAILRRRLDSVTALEWRVLEILTLARRPICAQFVQRVLAGIADEGSDASRQEDGSRDVGESAGGEEESQDDQGEQEEQGQQGEQADQGRQDEPDEEVSAGREEPGAVAIEAVREALRALNVRALVEQSAPSHPEEGEDPEVYSFRLRDYGLVVEERIPDDRRCSIHERIGEECLARLNGASGEGAYEVYYHLSRGLDPVSAVDYGKAAAQRFVRSFALEKARLICGELAELLAGENHLPQRLEMLEQVARLSISLKDYKVAEESLRSLAQIGSGVLTPQSRLEHLLLEAEVARVSDPARALKILGKAPRLLSEEVSREGACLYLAITRARLDRQDWKRSINFGLRGVAICQKLEDAPELGAFYQLMARAFYRKGDSAHAVDNYQRGLEAAERVGDHALMVDILDELGRVYLERGNYFRSARYLYKALEMRRRDHDVAGLCRSYDQLGLVYRRTGDYLKTIENLNRSLSLKERIGDYTGLNPTLGTLGDLYFRLGRHQLAIRYFQREVENSQKLREFQLDDTAGLADAFERLGRVYFEIGDLKQSESLCKQVLILASEFKLRSQEADGLLLDGNLKALEREWAAAEKSLKQASEAHGKLGHRRREASALLDLAEVKYAREYWDEALKLATKAHVLADEIKVLDLQVRALTIKGNVHRVLKGGNPEKVRDLLGKGLELAQSLSDADVLFQLFYSLAKVFHSDREFAEAANYYGKAESILKRIVQGLPEGLATRYFDDPRRKVFSEDLARFRKEAHSRNSVADERVRGAAPVDLRERPVAVADYKELHARVLRTNGAFNQLHFYDRVLQESVELVGADRGFILRVQSRQYEPVGFQGFGPKPTQHPEYAAASHLAEEATRRGNSVLHCASEDENDDVLEFGTLSSRSFLIVPLMTDERIFGGVYVDKPASMGHFTARDQTLLETYAQHAGVMLQNRRQLDIAIREPLTGFYTPSYFIERLREAYRWFNLHGKVFSLAGFYLPALEDALGDGRAGMGEKLASEIGELVPFRSAVCWGNPVLYLLFTELDLPAAEDVAGRVSRLLEKLFNEQVSCEVLAADRRYQQGAELYFEIRRKLLPEECDQKTLVDLRRLLARDITIKEAKRILEKHIIERTLRKTGGNITHAARELGIHRPQLSNYLKKYGLKRELFERGLEGGVHQLEN